MRRVLDLICREADTTRTRVEGTTSGFMTSLMKWAALPCICTVLACAQPSPDVPPTATPTATATHTPPRNPSPTAAATPTATATAIPTNTPTRTATAPPSATPDRTRAIQPPEHIAYIWWGWRGEERPAGFEELTVDFTIMNDPKGLPDGIGLYFMTIFGRIAGIEYYFGLQVDSKGKRAIFSRWDERDPDYARADPQEGWMQSSGHEGDFIGVRRHLEWRAGPYTARLAADGADDDGVWYGVWITDRTTDVTKWVGSLWFPNQDGRARINGSVYSTLEVYGSPTIRPIDIPQWAVAVGRPTGNGVPAIWGSSGYSGFGSNIPNSNIHYDRDGDVVDIQVGGLTERTTAPWELWFE